MVTLGRPSRASRGLALSLSRLGCFVHRTCPASPHTAARAPCINSILRSYVTLTHKAPIVDQTQKAPQETVKEHYKEHSHRKFYQELVDSMSSGPIVIIHLRGSKAVSRIRNMLGATDPSTADPGSLRGTYGIDKTNNFMVTDYLHIYSIVVHI